MKKLLLSLSVALVLCVALAIGIQAETVSKFVPTAEQMSDCIIDLSGLPQSIRDAITIPSPSVGFKYDLNTETKTATLVHRGDSFSSTDKVVCVPSYVYYQGDTYTVTELNDKGAGTQSVMFKKQSVVAVYIPDTVTRISGGNSNGMFGVTAPP